MLSFSILVVTAVVLLVVFILTVCSLPSHSFRWPFSKLVAFLSATFYCFLRSFLFLSDVLEAFCCYSQPSWKLLTVFVGCLGSFLLLLSAILEASHCFCRLSWKLSAVIVSHLGSFSLFLFAVLEASHCFSRLLLLCCSCPFFSFQSVILSTLLFILSAIFLEVLVGCSLFKVQSKYPPTTVEMYNMIRNFQMSPAVLAVKESCTTTVPVSELCFLNEANLRLSVMCSAS